MENLETIIENQKVWTVSIGDDKMLLEDGSWGTQQDLFNQSSSSITEDYYTKLEAEKLAADLNEKEGRVLHHTDLYYSHHTGLKAKVNLNQL